MKQRSVITVEEVTAKKVKKGHQGRRVEEHIIVKKKVKQSTADTGEQ